MLPFVAFNAYSSKRPCISLRYLRENVHRSSHESMCSVLSVSFCWIICCEFWSLIPEHHIPPVARHPIPPSLSLFETIAIAITILVCSPFNLPRTALSAHCILIPHWRDAFRPFLSCRFTCTLRGSPHSAWSSVFALIPVRFTCGENSIDMTLVLNLNLRLIHRGELESADVASEVNQSRDEHILPRLLRHSHKLPSLSCRPAGLREHKHWDERYIDDGRIHSAPRRHNGAIAQRQRDTRQAFPASGYLKFWISAKVDTR
ncbi:unnamed protein product [Somion occarium]|uniref:Uncharacterized protein n=1 Tax=Somion occarium TaxID=3059160 RepID=A0ABP1CZJ3_9APHY